MSLGESVSTDNQLIRLLQIGVVLEEVVEARAGRHAQELDASEDNAVREFLEEASAESAEHRDMLESLIEDLDAETVAFEEIKTLVEAQYEADADFDDVLYDQLCNEETAYKFYEDLIEAISQSDSEFSIDRERLLSVLEQLRDAEAEGVEDVTRLMEANR